MLKSDNGSIAVTVLWNAGAAAAVPPVSSGPGLFGSRPRRSSGRASPHCQGLARPAASASTAARGNELAEGTAFPTPVLPASGAAPAPVPELAQSGPVSAPPALGAAAAPPQPGPSTGAPSQPPGQQPLGRSSGQLLLALISPLIGSRLKSTFGCNLGAAGNSVRKCFITSREGWPVAARQWRLPSATGPAVTILLYAQRRSLPGEQLASLERQTFKWKLIASDDGSWDRTVYSACLPKSFER